MIDFRQQFRSLLSLGDDKIEDTEAIENIVSGTQFKGTSLWILVCAIFIASLGLNMNSTAVIIGAMLISPLMGPIMGIGLGFGIHDIRLIKHSAKNLSVATLFALAASCIYFMISPVSEVRSELLARTQPSIYDVMIAFFGGFAGIIATGSRQKGNILPGVAIATALMPPLCTAGYGLATLQWQFFFGASYLFLINAVYIGLATWLGVRLLGLPKLPDNKVNVATVRWMVALLVVVLIPSLFTTFRIVKEDIRNRNMSQYVEKELRTIPGIKVITYHYKEKEQGGDVEVVLVGPPISDQNIAVLEARLGTYSLDDCHLRVVQADQSESEERQLSREKNLLRSVIDPLTSEMLQLKEENDSLRQLVDELRDQLRSKESSAETDTVQ